MEEINITDGTKEAIINYYSGRLSEDQAYELLLWISQNDTNLQYFQIIGEIWHSSGTLSEHEYDTNKALDFVRKKIIKRNIRWMPEKEIHIRFSLLYNAAAILFVIILIGSMYILKRPGKVAPALCYFEAIAPKGSKSQLVLADGTKIWLNAGSTLRYNSDYGNSNRDVYLDGEAYFKVSNNKNLPFMVNTSDICVTALGTAFNIKSYSDEEVIETTLEEGILRIDPLNTGNNLKESKPIVLKPSQKVIFLKHSKNTVLTDRKEAISLPASSRIEKSKTSPVKVYTLSDTRPYTSWKDSHWVFKNEKLAILAPKLERRFDVKIEFKDTTLLNYSFSGTLKEESLEQVLEAIRLTAPIKFKIDSKQVLLQVDKQLKIRYDNLMKSNSDK